MPAPLITHSLLRISLRYSHLWGDRDHGHRDARNADEPLPLIANLNLPHLARPAAMHGTRGCRDHALADGPQMIGIDLLPKTHLTLGIHAQVRRGAAHGLDGHGGAEKIRSDLREADAEALDQRIACALLQLLDARGVAPNAHSSLVYCR